METKKIKLKHRQTGRIFEYLETIRPQFSTADVVRLINAKTGTIEVFNANTYMNFFEKI